jgi:hypothetical protein
MLELEHSYRNCAVSIYLPLSVKRSLETFPQPR